MHRCLHYETKIKQKLIFSEVTELNMNIQYI